MQPHSNMKRQKISIITVVFNGEKTISDTIMSVSSQDYANVEYIIIDGASSDGTTAIIEKHKEKISVFVSELDNGIYDAMNKGVNLATGDLIGFLNADDIYAHSSVLSRVAATFNRCNVDACYGDLVYVRDDLSKIIRYYRSNRFSPKMLAYGWMPAHPTLFIKRKLFDRHGLFKTDYRIAADYEMVARLFWKHHIRYQYIPDVLVKMRMGGVSTSGVKSNYILSKEIVRACKENDINTSLPRVLLKYPLKIMEFFTRPV